MNYFYYQMVGGEERWEPIAEDLLGSVGDAMFVTVLSVDAPVGEDYDKEQYAAIKYKGPLYFDLDDAQSPASTAVEVLALIEK